MRAVELVFGVGWAAFWLYWLVAAFSMKRGRVPLSRELRIGRNWGTPMAQKDEPELVTNGPYRLVRHPIYSGILAAGAGTAVALSWLWLIAVALTGVYFIYSAMVEERYLTDRFPDTYPAYKRSTKLLLPFVL
jgi:protein-S-isoprenylcysteine O-methyltransferase Ste14